MNADVSPLDLERFVLDELPEDRKKLLAGAIECDPRLRSEVENIQRSNAEDADRYPANVVVPQIRALRLRSETEAGDGGRREKTRRLLFILSPAFAAALLLIVLILPGRKGGLLPRLMNPAEDTSIAKGGTGLDLDKTHLLVYRLRNAAVEQLSGGETARAGDLLQLAYVSTVKYGLILSIDGDGTVSLHFPENAEADTALTEGQKILLPEAVELDDAPGFERFFLITSETPFNVRSVLRTAEDLARNPDSAERGDLALAPGLNQTSFLVRK